MSVRLQVDSLEPGQAYTGQITIAVDEPAQQLPVRMVMASPSRQSSNRRQSVRDFMIQREIDTRLAQLADAGNDARQESVRRFVEIGSFTVMTKLIETMQHADKEVAETAVQSLTQIGPPAIAPLGEALANPQYGRHDLVVQILGQIGGDAAISTLADALPHQQEAIRLDILREVARDVEKTPLEAVIACLNDVESIKSQAIAILESVFRRYPDRIGTIQSALLPLLEDASEPIRRATVQALKVHVSVALIDPFSALLERQDEATDICCMAVEALAVLGSEAVLEPLVQALLHPSSDVRCAAILSLRQVGRPEAIEFLELVSSYPSATGKERLLAIEALLQLDPNRESIEVSGQKVGAYQRISDAIAEAQPWAAVRVQPGVYRESLQLDKPIVLIGEGDPGQVVIEATANVIHANTSDALIRNVTLKYIGNRNSPALDFTGRRPILEDCNVCSTDGMGVYIEVAPMPTARTGVTAAVVDSKVYAIGGHSGSDHSTVESTVEVYDPLSNTWESVKPMPTARHFLAAVVVDGRIYAIGGHNGSYQSTVEVYDPLSNTWESVKPISGVRGQLAAAVVDGRVYVIGGADGKGREY